MCSGRAGAGSRHRDGCPNTEFTPDERGSTSGPARSSHEGIVSFTDSKSLPAGPIEWFRWVAHVTLGRSVWTGLRPSNKSASYGCDEPLMPPQARSRTHNEHRPRPARHHTTQHREQHPRARPGHRDDCPAAPWIARTRPPFSDQTTRRASFATFDSARRAHSILTARQVLHKPPLRRPPPTERRQKSPDLRGFCRAL